MLTRSDYQTLALQLTGAASQRQTTTLFRRSCPHIVQQLQQDCRRRGPLSFWGCSVNHDELAHQEIVHAAVLKAIGTLTYRSLSPTTPHAGLQHTYAYLFSTLNTPYGFKRDRWFDPYLTDAIGLPQNLLSPDPPESTLLAHVTWIAGQVAFRGHSERHRLTDYLKRKVAPEVRRFSGTRPSVHRIEETVRLRSGNHRPFSVRLRTHLVPSIDPTSDRTVLIYSWLDSRINAPRLTTMFTVNAASRDALLERARQGGRQHIRPRYNACIPGFQSPAEGTIRCS